jgi:enediyne biosynthesis protein E4
MVVHCALRFHHDRYLENSLLSQVVSHRVPTIQQPTKHRSAQGIFCGMLLLAFGAGCGEETAIPDVDFTLPVGITDPGDSQTLPPPLPGTTTPFDRSLAGDLCVGEGTPLFEDVTEYAGSGHIHRVATGLDTYEGSMGGGVVMEDLNGDDLLDLYVTNGNGPNAMYLNQGDGIFLDAAAAGQMEWSDDWSIGASAADLDNDGDQDIYLANNGPNRLLRNLGNGVFEDATAGSGLDLSARTAGASFADVNRDGHLDVFVSNLAIDMNPANGEITAESSYLFLNNGDFTFRDVSLRVSPEGIPAGASYITPLIDMDDDGWIDIFLTQEFGFTLSNRLYRNAGIDEDGELLFEDFSSNDDVQYPHAVMGAAILDPNADGLPDFFFTNLWGESPGREVFLLNEGNMNFVDAASEYGLYALTPWDWDYEWARAASWGTTALDQDNDGDEDVYLVYGHWNSGVDFQISESGYPPLRKNQPNAFFQNQGNDAFSLLYGTCSEENGAGRGVAAGDLDGDGCLDLYIVNQNQPARQLRNLCSQANQSLVLRLIGTADNRDAVGAKVTLRIGTETQTRWVLAGSRSVHGSHPKWVHFGLGENQRADEIIIRWPNGQTQTLRDVAASSYLEVVQQ